MSKKDFIMECVYAGPEMMNNRIRMPDPPVDGDGMEAPSIVCPKCGKRQPVDAKFCCECGMPLKSADHPAPAPQMPMAVYAGPQIPSSQPNTGGMGFVGMGFAQPPYPQNYQEKDEDPGDVYAGPPIDDEPCDE